LPPSSLIADARLGNIDQGAYAGSTQTQFSSTELYRAWHSAPTTVRFPGGETLGDVKARVSSFLQENLSGGRSLNLVVGHTTPLQVLTLQLLGLPLRNVWQFYYAPFSATIIYGNVLLMHNGRQVTNNWTTQIRE